MVLSSSNAVALYYLTIRLSKVIVINSRNIEKLYVLFITMTSFHLNVHLSNQLILKLQQEKKTNFSVGLKIQVEFAQLIKEASTDLSEIPVHYVTVGCSNHLIELALHHVKEYWQSGLPQL